MNFWKMKKLTHNQCISDLLQARDPSSLKLVEIVEGFRAKELEDWIWGESQRVIEKVFSTYRRFRRHAVVEEYLASIDKQKFYNVKDRAPSLLLAGPSQCGKTSFAIHLCGGPPQ